MYVCFHLHVYIHTVCMPGSHGGQKSASKPWELELQIFMSHPVGTLQEQQMFITTEPSL